ncbi:MAG: aspartate aminotransferase family protein [Caldilineaceae bacterium]|nr:aspartate aminotransferase family protein [Caldilineaceae bacterium]
MKPLTSGATPAQVAADLAPLLDFQADGMGADDLSALIRTRLLPHLMDYGSPTFQSMFNAAPAADALLGAQIALAHNQGVTNWQVSPGGAMLEELAGRALCRLFGLADTADATFMYSGTYANQEALYLALHRHAERRGFDLAEEGMAGFTEPRRLLVLTSQDAHFSVKHAVRMLGLGERSLRLLPVDTDRRIDVEKARTLVDQLAVDHEIVCIVATAGTTSTGAVDPIAPLAELAARHDAWLHVDGAYGYAYKLVPEWAPLFAGDERADSITWDPHKQLGVPIPNSLLFVRDRRDFARMALFSGYFNRADDPMPNPGLKSPPSTRPMSALPLVTALRGRGVTGTVDDLRTPLAAMRALADWIRTLPDVELCHTPDTGILCFRITPPGRPRSTLAELQRTLYTRIMDEGTRTVSTTTLDGETVLRLVSVSPTTTVDDLRATVETLRAVAGRET